MKARLLACIVPLLLAGCERIGEEAMVVALDPAWNAEIVLTNADGIAAPDGLLWADGRLYIADEGGSAVRVWIPGKGVETLADAGAGLSSPEDVVRNAAGTLFVTDDDIGGVWRIDGNGVARLAGAVKSSEGLALAPSGAMLVGDPRGRRIVRAGEDGAVAPFLPGRISKPESMAFDGAGNLYIADNEDEVLYLLTPKGRLHRPIHGRKDFSPESLHFAQNALFITDSAHGKLFRYTPEDGLTAIAVFAGDLANVQGIASDPAGNLYVSIQTDLEAARGYVLRLRNSRQGL